MKLIPTGIENFKTMIDKNAYYVDKTNLIADILNEQVVLYTRPRRFGKTLNMSMLYYFFSIKEKENAYLFNDLYISKNKEALEHQNKYPTIFISLKEMKNLTFDAQISSFSSIIYELLEKNLEILSASQLTDATKKKLNSLHDETTSIEDLKFSLRIISNALYTYYHQKVIILIDEYDVPLQSAYQNNYYDEMVDFLRSVFSSALKTNDALEKGVMTGCLRISKESIFTGLNNFKTYSLLEQLIQGKSLEKYIKPELTYREMDHINNIYSFLLLTGYLRVIEDLGENKYKLVIPNKEVYEIYKQSFMSYFEDYTFVRKEDLYQCLVREDVDQANEILGDILSRSISYFDNQESFYHGFLVGLFSGKKIKSNREAMHGRFDLCILPKQIFQTALILECKHSKSVKELVSDAKEGAKQIIDNKYEDEIINDGYLHVKGYGISFYKKYCYIVKAENS